jgi:hypothetical protein
MMNTIVDFLTQNKIAVGSVLAAFVLFGDKLKILPTKLKSLLPFKKEVVVSSDDSEDADQAALRHLRGRAHQSGNQELIKMIRSIDMMFYDIHIGAKNENK